MNEKILRLKEVVEIIGLSRSTIYREVAKGNFPKPIQLTGHRSVGWKETAVVKWVESREYA